MSQNLIRLVDGVQCPCPSTFSYGLQDVSASDSGRDESESALMYKNRVVQKRKIELSWNGLRPDKVSEIMKLFNPEYIQVTYWDAMDGVEETRTFYVGDRSAPVKIWTATNKVFTSVSFNIIER